MDLESRGAGIALRAMAHPGDTIFVWGYRPNVVDLMKRGEIALLFNTPEDGRARKDSYLIRRTAVNNNIPYYLTVDGAQAAIGAIEALLKGEHQVRSLQEYHADE